MLNRITRGRRVPAIAGAILVVAVIGGGTATAASLITSKDVKDNTLRSRDVHDGSLKVKDLTAKAVSTLQKGGPKGATGATGATGPQGAKGDKGDASVAQYGLATVNVSRGGAPASVWATYSTVLGSPVGDTTGGTFRFTCSTAKAPCTVSVKAAGLGTGTLKVYPRVLISRQSIDTVSPSMYCEYGDGSTGVDFATIAKQGSTSTPTYTAMKINIGGSADCGGPETTFGDVDQITVPAGYYDVQSTFAFVS
ncbi:MAG: hypothetical protein ABI807_04335 [Sporichthyaceae bacterium]